MWLRVSRLISVSRCLGSQTRSLHANSGCDESSEELRVLFEKQASVQTKNTRQDDTVSVCSRCQAVARKIIWSALHRHHLRSPSKNMLPSWLPSLACTSSLSACVSEGERGSVCVCENKSHLMADRVWRLIASSCVGHTLARVLLSRSPSHLT